MIKREKHGVRTKDGDQNGSMHQTQFKEKWRGRRIEAVHLKWN